MTDLPLTQSGWRRYLTYVNNIHSSSGGKLLILCLLAFAMGCTSGWDNPGPRESFEGFLIDLSNRKYEEAFLKIDPDDRASLLAAKKSLVGINPEDLPEDHEMLVVAGFDYLFDIKRMTLEEKLEKAPALNQRVTIKIEYKDGQSKVVVMKWGGEQWFVDLPLDDAKSEQSDG